MSGRVSTEAYGATRPWSGKRNRQEEERLQRQVANYLDLALARDCLWWHTPNGGLRSKATAGKLKAMGVRPGVSDILILSAARGLHAIELKTLLGGTTEAQRQFLDHVRASGGQAAEARSLEQVVELVRGWGLARGVPEAIAAAAASRRRAAP